MQTSIEVVGVSVSTAEAIKWNFTPKTINLSAELICIPRRCFCVFYITLLVRLFYTPTAAQPKPLMKAIQPFREDLVIGVEYMCS